ncbi:DUF4231 domain-containing protein [Nocardioides zeae]|uniref:DUF4231 domain-containing protein n=1 Tax=Nocardioides imazamoxiresistens TaxID=3231893 RepID=A0ABU3PRL5_9ACTN|nr:DUF4231 domain-containing protein [Nocardioides zeae]MDT9591838.1 DUF4231 domain-containing protein [Nocardioides zeae]
MTSPVSVTDDDMPQLFQAADRASTGAQEWFVRGTRFRLGLLVLAAAMGIAVWRVGAADIDVLAIVSTVLFVLAILVEGVLWKSRPDKTWYDARAVAESAKTLAWKFAVRSEPFSDPSVDEATMARRLLSRFDEIRRQFPDLELAAVNAQSISPWMKRQRQADWPDRRSVYLRERLQNQKNWYEGKAGYNRGRSNQWRFALIALEFLGFVASLAAAFYEWTPMIAPVIAALVAAVVAWLEAKQHDFNARAYAAAVHDLAQAEARLQLVRTEAEWATEVESAEEAISREHTLWLASRNGP